MAGFKFSMKKTSTQERADSISVRNMALHIVSSGAPDLKIQTRPPAGQRLA